MEKHTPAQDRPVSQQDNSVPVVQQQQATPQNAQNSAQNAPPVQESDKEYVVTLILSYLLGSFGVDRFYVGKIGTGVLKLLTFGGFGIWWLIDFYVIGTGKFKDNNNLPLKGTSSALDIGKPITIAIVIVTAITYVLTMIWVTITLILSIATVGTISNVQNAVNDDIKEASQMASIDRDLERQKDLSNLSRELEIYYAKQGYYPSIDELNSSSWRLSNTPNVTTDTLTDPLSRDAVLLVVSDTDNYGYRALNASGGECEGGGQCVSYTLTATKESANGNPTITIVSLN